MSTSLLNLSYINVKILGFRTRALLDTGSYHSIINSKLAKKLRLDVRAFAPDEDKLLYGANGSPMNLLGKADTLIDMHNLKIPQTMRVCDSLTENLILGRSFLQDSEAKIDFCSKIVTFCDDSIEIPLQHLIDNRTVVRICRPTIVPPKSEIVIPETCNRIYNNKEVILKAIEGKQLSQFAVANSIVSVNNEKTICRLMNFQDKPLVLCTGQRIGQLEFFDRNMCLAVSNLQVNDKEEDAEILSEEGLLEFEKEFNFQINQEMSREIKLKLLAVLYKRKKAFSRNPDEISCYNKEEFEIKLKKGAKPSFQRQFRHKPEHAKFLQQHIDLWERTKIIDPCYTYEWNNAVFLVPKASLRNKTEGINFLDFRPCLDQRGSNQAIEKRIFYNPPVKQIIEEITKYTVDENGDFKRAAYFTGIDLNQAFMQIKVKKESRHIQSFIAPNGQKWMLNRLAYGNRNSPAIFAQIIDRIFAPLRNESKLNFYMDDILLYSTSITDHIKQIDKVLEILIENNLTCSTKKTLFMQTTIKHLGVIISPEGISVPDSVNLTLDKLAIKPIKTVKQVQSLLGMLNFWRNFIKNFALRSENLRKLTQKGTTFNFDQKCKDEQADLINALRHPPTLSPVDPRKSLWLLVDASKAGVGFTVAQTQADIEDDKQIARELANLRKGATTLKPIFFYSYATTKQTALYPATSLELWGLGKAIMTLEYLTQAHVLNIVSDNVGVTSLQTLRAGNGRERRLLAYLMQFDMKLHYLKGPLHTSSDYLSRWMKDSTETELAELRAPDENILDDIIFNINEANNEIDTEGDIHVGEWMLYSLTNHKEVKTSKPQTENNEVNNIDDIETIEEENPNQINEAEKISFSLFDDKVQELTINDYLEDEAMGPITQYLLNDSLTGSKAVDYKTLISSPLYALENEKLYRHDLPKNKKRSLDNQPEKLLVLPSKWKNEYLTKLHKAYGHPAQKKLYNMARSLFYFKELFTACGETAESCPDCQFSKINRKKIIPPLVLTPRFRPNSTFYLDYKKLARPTAEGFKHIFVMIEAFSNYPYYELTKTTTAVETAQAIVKRLIPEHGAVLDLISDKGSCFVSSVFKSLTRDILGSKHWLSASRQPISHGLVENQIAQLAKAIRLYCKNDLEIPQALPLLELHARLSVQDGLGYSPFHILKGYQPTFNLPELNETELKTPIKSHENYIEWLQDRLARIRADVDKNIKVSREIQKRSYDLRMKVKEPNFEVGMTVLLHTGQPRAHSDQILSHKKFGNKKYFITKIVSKDNEFVPTEENKYPAHGEASIGKAYQLCDTITGKALKHLVPAFRMKKFIEQDEFNKKYPPLPPKIGTPVTELVENAIGTPETNQNEATLLNQNDNETAEINNEQTSSQKWYPAKSISRKRTINKQLQYLIRWEDGTQSWQNQIDVSPALIQRFFIKQANKNRQRQRAARNRFK